MMVIHLLLNLDFICFTKPILTANVLWSCQVLKLVFSAHLFLIAMLTPFKLTHHKFVQVRLSDLLLTFRAFSIVLSITQMSLNQVNAVTAQALKLSAGNRLPFVAFLTKVITFRLCALILVLLKQIQIMWMLRILVY